ncbi:MAG: hypothetical protein KDD35_09345, partial [Bdellovibrionales bacterium]|nr:hypothetical protein [Bdellovibrionales bacterium]
MGKYQVADLTCLILWVLFALFCGPLSFAQESFGCKVLLSAVRGPEVEQEFDLMSLTEAALKAVLNDYERTLEVYYELKNKEPNPKSFVNEFGGQKLRDTFGEEAFSSLPDEIKNSPASVCHTCEFRRSEYDLYRDYLDNDIRLSNNLFLALFNHHG